MLKICFLERVSMEKFGDNCFQRIHYEWNNSNIQQLQAETKKCLCMTADESFDPRSFLLRSVLLFTGLGSSAVGV